MGDWLRPALLIAGKDLRVELRTRDVLGAVGLFALLVVTVVSFTFPAFGDDRLDVAAGMLWMAFLFASLLGVGRSFAVEKEDACLEGLVLSPVPRESIFLGKLLSNLVFTGAVEVAIILISIVLLQLDVGRALGLLVLTALLGTVALVIVETLFASMAVNTRTREAILPLLVVPPALPVMMAAVKGTSSALVGDSLASVGRWILLLLAVDAVFFLVAVATFPYLVED